MKKAYHKMLMSGGILIGDVNNYVKMALRGNCREMPWGSPLAFMPIACCHLTARMGSTKHVPSTTTG